MTAVAPPLSASGTLTLESLLEHGSWRLPQWSDECEVFAPDRLANTMDRLDEAISLLAKYRNSLRPVVRLSPDVLLLIFREIAELTMNPNDMYFGSYPWRTISHVCQLWRSVALSSPILWTHLSTRYPNYALACIDRSGEAPFSLNVVASSNFDKVETVIKAVLPHAGRLRTLVVPTLVFKENNGELYELLQSLFALPAPALETLETEKVRLDVPWVTLPTIFTGATPNLSRLRLQYILPEVTALTLSKIRVLTIRGRKHYPMTLGVSKFLDIIEACPCLEILSTEKVVYQGQDADEGRRIELDHLRYLEIGRTEAKYTMQLLSHIVIPRCAIRMRVWMDRDELNRFHIGLPSAIDLDIDHRFRDIRKLHVNFMNVYDGVEILGSMGEYPFWITASLDQNTISHLGDMDAVSGSVLKSIANALDLDNLEEFAITELRNNIRWMGYPKELWVSTLQSMPNLQSMYITVDGGYDEGISRTIIAALRVPSERTGLLLCPNLKKISVWGDKTWSALECYKMAKQRARSEHRLERVSMRLAHYSSFIDVADTDLTFLRRVVDIVDLEPVDIVLPQFPEWS